MRLLECGEGKKAGYAEQIPNTSPTQRGYSELEASTIPGVKHKHYRGSSTFQRAKSTNIKSKKYWWLVGRALLVENIDLGIENTASLIFLAGQQWSFPFYFISSFHEESLAFNREGEELAQAGPRSGLEEEGMGK